MNHYFRLRGTVTPNNFIGFLYEFYWTGYLCIESARSNIQTKEFLEPAFRRVPHRRGDDAQNQSEPARTEPEYASRPAIVLRRLAFGFLGKRIKSMSRHNVFQYSLPGVDDADWTVLAAMPTIESPDGKTTTQTHWRVLTTGKTLIVPLGGELSVGTFVGTVQDVVDDMIILKQSNGYNWILGLGDRLSNAACIPEIF